MPQLLKKAHQAPYSTRETALAAAWRTFGHQLDPRQPVVIYYERGTRGYLEFRVQQSSADTTPLEITQWWRECPHGLTRFETGLRELLKGGEINGGDVIKGQWAAYACIMRKTFDAYRALKRDGHASAAEIQARRMQAAEMVLREIAPAEMRNANLSLWWDKPEGQMQFEHWLKDFAHNPGYGHQAEIWAMRLPAYTVAAREFFNFLDQLHVYVRLAKDQKQERVRERSNGKVLEVSPYADPYAVRELKREGGM
jgi:hypothetical protein